MKTLFLAGTLLFLWADTALSAAAAEKFAKGGKGHAVTCAAILSKRTFTLSADLDCSNATAPITVRDRADLNLNGHTLIGEVVLDGAKAQVRNGTIFCNGFSVFPCVTVQGAGGHTVKGLRVEESSFSPLINVISNNNTIIANTLYNTPAGGLNVEGNSNIIEGNIAITAGQIAFEIKGNKNTVIRNHAAFHIINYVISGNNNSVTRNSADGFDEHFRVHGDNNRIMDNVMTEGQFGLTTVAENNHIEGNIGVLTEFIDLNPNCGTNDWTGNVFQSSNQPCVQ